MIFEPCWIYYWHTGLPYTKCSVPCQPQFSPNFRACLKCSSPYLCSCVFSGFRVQLTRHPERTLLTKQHTGVCLVSLSALNALCATFMQHSVQFAISYFVVSLLISATHQLVQESKYHFISFKIPGLQYVSWRNERTCLSLYLSDQIFLAKSWTKLLFSPILIEEFCSLYLLLVFQSPFESYITDS